MELHGHPLALRLARQELEGSADQWLPAADWQERKRRHWRTLRSFGVVVAASPRWRRPSRGPTAS